MTDVRVLIVDDQEPFRRAAEAVVGMTEGFLLVGSAPDGESSLEAVQEHHPDLVLMDVHLRGGDDGIKAAEAIRALLPARIVFATAYAEDPRTRERMLAAQPAGILSKPILPQDLGRALAGLGNAPEA